MPRRTKTPDTANDADPGVGISELLDGESWGCAWGTPRKCTALATHRHHAYGGLCPKHAVEVMMLHPKDKVDEIAI